MKLKRFSGFSLMEMMVVLLIVAIVMAASAPMVSRRMIRDAAGGSGDCLWEDNTSYIYPAEKKNVLIGTDSIDSEMVQKASLHVKLKNKDTVHQIYLHDLEGKFAGLSFNNGGVSFGPIGVANTGAVAVGQSASASSGSVAIGSMASAYCSDFGEGNRGAIAIGPDAKAQGGDAVAIGSSFDGAIGNFSLSINGSANGENAIAIGQRSQAGANSVALGYNADAIGNAETAYTGSVAIGNNVSVGGNNEIALGNENHTVKIRGNLIVDGNVTLGSTGKSVYVQVADTESSPRLLTKTIHAGQYLYYGGMSSDRRLKDVGEVFKGGLEELKKLDLYNYTFKNDKNKSPRVGVMAQDLQKIFPDAVITGEDGFLRIRMEDMFFAVINAVKELDSKIAQITEQVKANLDLTAKLQEKIDSQEKEIIELKEQNAEFEKRLAKLEKKARKDKSVED